MNPNNFIEAFVGPRDARNKHSRSTSRRPRSIAASLQIVRKRWPDLQSGSEEEPVFILAAGWRTGSTFLQRIVMSTGTALIWGEPYRRAEIVDSLSRQLTAFTEQWPSNGYFVDPAEKDQFSTSWVANLYPVLEDFMAAHIAYFERLFARPARALQKDRWGLKDILLTVDHAHYLRWLFPRARFIFVYRNPYDAYRSYRQKRNFYRRWPDQPVFTPVDYGKLWKEFTNGFVERSAEVDGLLLRYEELKTPATKKRIENYLGFPIANPDSLSRIGRSIPQRGAWLPRLEARLLRQQIEPLSSTLGYVAPSR